MRIGMMLRALDEHGGISVYTRNLVSELLRIDRKNRYLLFFKSKKNIRDSIKIFLDPTAGTITHGRSINRDEARSCGLNIEDLNVHSPEWLAIYELYARTDFFVNSAQACKAVESREDAFYVSP